MVFNIFKFQRVEQKPVSNKKATTMTDKDLNGLERFFGNKMALVKIHWRKPLDVHSNISLK